MNRMLFSSLVVAVSLSACGKKAPAPGASASPQAPQAKSADLKADQTATPLPNIDGKWTLVEGKCDEVPWIRDKENLSDSLVIDTEKKLWKRVVRSQKKRNEILLSEEYPVIEYFQLKSFFTFSQEATKLSLVDGSLLTQKYKRFLFHPVFSSDLDLSRESRSTLGTEEESFDYAVDKDGQLVLMRKLNASDVYKEHSPCEWLNRDPIMETTVYKRNTDERQETDRVDQPQK